MAILDKITEVAKNVADKTSDVAKSVADKTSDVAKSVADKTTETLEIRALNSQISDKQREIAEFKVKLGEYYWTRYAEGVELEAGAADLCAEIKAAEDDIAACQAAIQAKKETDSDSALPEAAEVVPGVQCPSCEGMNPENAKFCSNCGVELEIQLKNPACLCGANLAPGSNFCNECGKPVQEGDF